MAIKTRPATSGSKLGNKGGGVNANVISDFRWWLGQYKGERWKVVQRLVKDLRDEQRGRIEADVLHMALYGGRETMGYGLASYWQGVDRYDDSMAARLGVNLTKNAVNAIVSKVGKDKPRPTVVTDDADWDLANQAEDMQRFLDGAFYDAGVYETDQRWLLNCGVLGTGHLKIFRTDDPTEKDDPAGLGCEVALPGSIILDDRLDGLTGKPRSIFQIYYIDKGVLSERCSGDKKALAAIEKAPVPREDEVAIGLHRKTNQIRVIEAWHLRSGPNATDGRHCICIDGYDLLDVPYKRDRFPFVKLDYDDELAGYWGTGIAFQALGYQCEINDLLLKAQKILHLAAVPHVFVETASLAPTDTYNNEIMSIWEYSGGTAPTVVMPQNLIGELMKQAGMIREWFYQDLGISQMMSQGEKPAGVDAAVALEALSDMDSERHIRLGRRWEAAHMEAAEHFIELAEEIAEGDEELGHVKKDFAVTFRGDDSMGRLNWKDVKMSRDSFVLQITPSSAIANTVAGRIKRGSELLKLGALDIDQFLTVLNLGDVKRATSDRTAAYKYIQKTITSIVKHGKYIGPESDDNKQLAATMILAALQRAKTGNVSEDKLQMLRDYLLALKGQSQPEGAESGPAMPSLAPGLGMPGTPGVPPPGMPPPPAGAGPGGPPPQLPPGPQGPPPGAVH